MRNMIFAMMFIAGVVTKVNAQYVQTFPVADSLAGWLTPIVTNNMPQQATFMSGKDTLQIEKRNVGDWYSLYMKHGKKSSQLSLVFSNGKWRTDMDEKLNHDYVVNVMPKFLADAKKIVMK